MVEFSTASKVVVVIICLITAIIGGFIIKDNINKVTFVNEEGTFIFKDCKLSPGITYQLNQEKNLVNLDGDVKCNLTRRK